MAGPSAQFHEDTNILKPETRDRHRAIASVMEELEAVDWYDQRIDATGDEELRAILRHNRDEEKEHAAMVLEWLRRHDPSLSDQLREYLFVEGPIMQKEKELDAAEAGDVQSTGDGSLGIGSLRKEGRR